MTNELPKMTENYHAPLRMAVMREDVSLIIQLVKDDPRLLEAFDNLAMIIAVYHNKQNSIGCLTKLIQEYNPNK